MEPATRSGQGDVGEALPWSLIDLVPAAILVADPDGAALWANRVWTQLTGQAEQDWRGHGWLEVGDGDPDLQRDELLAAVRSRTEYRADWTVSTNGRPRRMLDVQAAPHIETDGLARIVTTAIDVTDERERTARLLDQATHDSLTGLFNRAQFVEFLQHALDRRRRTASGLAVLFVDIDHLKATNDRLGHAAGDERLRDVAARITAAVRPADIVARYGGDEFTILCEDLADTAEAEAIAERIRTMSSGHADGDISVGVAITTEPASDPASIVAEADRSMYAARRANGHRPTAGRRTAPRPLIGTTGASAGRSDRAEREEHEGLRLIAVAAREMRTLLATIEAFASTLRVDGGSSPGAEADSALEIIERQAQRLAVMLDQLLQLGQCHDGAPTLDAVDLADVVSDALIPLADR